MKPASTDEYTLYCFAQSGNAYKPALMLELAGAKWSPRFVDYFNGETRTPAYLAINAMGEVPLLEHRGQRLSQSGVILDYLASTLGRFGADGEDERREILRWLLFDNHKLTSYTATYRFLRVFVADPDPAVVAEFGKRAQAAWSVLDASLAGRRFVVGRGEIRRHRRIVRVAGIPFRGDHRRRVADEPLVSEPPGHQLLDLELRDLHAILQTPRRLLERAILHTV